MKKTIIFSTVIIALLSVFTFSSCKKSTETINIIGRWSVSSYSLNGTDQTTAYKAQYANYSINFDASKNYVETYTTAGNNITNAGAWLLINSGNDLQLTSANNSSVRTLHIISITNNTADLTESNGTQEYHWLKN
jgi:hypothetical protein